MAIFPDHSPSMTYKIPDNWVRHQEPTRLHESTWRTATELATLHPCILTYLQRQIRVFNVTATCGIRATRSQAHKQFSFQQDDNYVRCGSEKWLKESCERLHAVVTSFFAIPQLAYFQQRLPEAATHHQAEAQKKEGGTCHHNHAVQEIVGAWTSKETNKFKQEV